MLVSVDTLGHLIIHKQKPMVIVKKVVLVKCSTDGTQEACDEQRVIDIMEINSNWTEMETISAIEDAFSYFN